MDCGFDFFGKPTAIACSVTLVVAEFLYVRRIVQLENQIQELKDRQVNSVEQIVTADSDVLVLNRSTASIELPTYSATCSRSDIVDGTVIV